jgi:hypothetical protein
MFFIYLICIVLNSFVVCFCALTLIVSSIVPCSWASRVPGVERSEFAVQEFVALQHFLHFAVGCRRH